MRKAAGGLAVAVLAVAVLAAGCGAQHAAGPLAVNELRTLVLQPQDLPPDVQRFDFGPQVRADRHPGPRNDPGRFGREQGWKARYREKGRATIVESRVDVFGTASGARRDLDAYRAEFEQAAAYGWRTLDVPDVGDGSRGAMFVRVAAGGGVRYVTVAWRDRRLTASVTLAGLARATSAAQAVALARKQERHLAGLRE